MSALKVALILVGVGGGAAPQPQASLWRGKNTTQSLTVNIVHYSEHTRSETRIKIQQHSQPHHQLHSPVSQVARAGKMRRFLFWSRVEKRAVAS